MKILKYVFIFCIIFLALFNNKIYSEENQNSDKKENIEKKGLSSGLDNRFFSIVLTL